MKTIDVDKMTTGFNSAEFYLKIGDYVLILPPSTIKRLHIDLNAVLSTIPQSAIGTKPSKKREEPIAKQILKALYKGKQVTRSLIAINTKRKKRLPDG